MDCTEYPVVVADSDGFCLSVCDGKSIIITAEINKAIIIGSITVTGSGRSAVMQNIRWQRPNGFDSIIGKKLPGGTRKHNRIPYSRVSFLSKGFLVKFRQQISGGMLRHKIQVRI